MMKIGFCSPTSSVRFFIPRNISSETRSVTRCQMSTILLCRSPAVMMPAARWPSTSSTSRNALSIRSPFEAGMTMSAAEIEMPARVAHWKPRFLSASSNRTVASWPWRR